MASISERLLSRLCTFIAARMGLYFPNERRRYLEKAIGSTARELGFADMESCIEWFLSSSATKSHIEILAGYLTVGETYFFRERRVFEVLEEQVLPDLIHSRREGEKYLRIWSAGCATGEEPYSIAILLHKMIPDLQDWNITILATDINPHFLKKAACGLYGQWSFRDVEPWIKERYFRQTGDGSLEVLSGIKKAVTFSYHNLAEDPYPSLFHNINAMDVIFCRNVLMYFVEEQASAVIRNLHRTLMDGGWLILSPSETSYAMASHFAIMSFPDVILFRKKTPLSHTEQAQPHKATEEPAAGQPAPVEFIPERRLNTIPAEPESILKTNDSSHLPAGAEKIRVDPQNPKPDLYQEALTFYEQGCYVEAIERVEAFLSKNQSDASVMVLLARIYANLGRLGEALDWCEKGIAAEKLSAGTYYLMATILQELGRTDAAVISLRRALYLAPDHVLAHVALGNICRQQEKHREAGRHYGNALRLLRLKRPEEILDESEGMTAGRLVEIIQSAGL